MRIRQQGGGRDISSFVSNICNDDYIVQSIVEQHPILNKIHSHSLNTIRICSILMPDGVHILSAVLRMGVGKSRVDNATSPDNIKFEGATVGITTSGCLKEYAYGYYTGNRFATHPGGFVFKDAQIPSFDKTLSLIQHIHPRIGNFRLVSWDFAIRKDGEPILIEANMRKGGINFHQFNNGPLFANELLTPNGQNKRDLTKEVLDEVFINSK